MRKLVFVEDRCQTAAAAGDGYHVVVHGSRRYRLRIAWEIPGDGEVGHERQRALRVVKQLAEILFEGMARAMVCRSTGVQVVRVGRLAVPTGIPDEWAGRPRTTRRRRRPPVRA